MNTTVPNDDNAGAPGDSRTLAARYVLGLVSRRERIGLEHAMETNDALLADVGLWQDRFQALADRVDPIEPSPGVFEAIIASVNSEPQPGSTTVRADDGEWIRLLDGVYKKSLLIDREEGTESFLLRLDPGASCPAHSHTKTEECLVMEGEVIIGQTRFGVGDYHAVPADIGHLTISTQTGTTMFIRSELHG